MNKNNLTMQYPLPQFLEIKPKIAGPFNLRQLAYLIAGSLTCLIFYFTTSMMKFVIVSIPIMIIAFVLAFAKIKGFPVPTILVRSFGFLFKSKTYLWHKKEEPIYALPVKLKKKEKISNIVPTPQIAGESRLKKVSNLIEIHSK